MAETQMSKLVMAGSGSDALNWAAKEDDSTVEEAFGNEDVILADKEEDWRRENLTRKTRCEIRSSSAASKNPNPVMAWPLIKTFLIYLFA